MVEGLQGVVGSEDFLGDEQLIATAKHFLGDGGTDRGVDQGDTRRPRKSCAISMGRATSPPSTPASRR